MNSKNLQNFSFHDSGKKGAHPLWTNHRTARPLNLQLLKSFNIAELHNPYTRDKWLDLAAQISETQLTVEQIQTFDYDSYRKLLLLLKQSIAVSQSEQKTLDEQLSEQSSKLQLLRDKQSKLNAEQSKNRQTESEFKEQIEKLEQKRKTLKARYDEG